MSRDKGIERRVDELERGQGRLAEEIDQIRREMRALGVHLPELDPATPGKTPLSPEAWLSVKRKAAAYARSKKRGGDTTDTVKGGPDAVNGSDLPDDDRGTDS